MCCVLQSIPSVESHSDSSAAQCGDVPTEGDKRHCFQPHVSSVQVCCSFQPRAAGRDCGLCVKEGVMALVSVPEPWVLEPQGPYAEETEENHLL